MKYKFNFLRFYSPTCPHCKRLFPKWNFLTKKYKANKAINILRVNCKHDGDLCEEEDVDGVPTLNLYRNGKYMREYEGALSLKELIDAVESHQTNQGIKAWQKREKQRAISRKLKRKQKKN